MDVLKGFNDFYKRYLAKDVTVTIIIFIVILTGVFIILAMFYLFDSPLLVELFATFFAFLFVYFIVSTIRNAIEYKLVVTKLLKHAKRIELPLKKLECNCKEDNDEDEDEREDEDESQAITPTDQFQLTNYKMIVEYGGEDLESPPLPLEFLVFISSSILKKSITFEFFDLLFGKVEIDSYESEYDLVETSESVEEKSEKTAYTLELDPKLYETPWIVVLMDEKNPKHYFIDLESTAKNYFRLVYYQDA